MIAEIGQVTYRLWNGKFSLCRSDLEAFISFISSKRLDQLFALKWSWNSLMNKRIQSISPQEMSENFMALKMSQKIVGIAIKYSSERYYDYNPQSAKKTQVVCVLSPQMDLEETWRSEKGFEFRVKHFIDAREAHELASLFRPEESKDLEVPLWHGMFTLKGETLRTSLLQLARIEDFRSLPEIKWEWDDKSVKVIPRAQVKSSFSRLCLRGNLVAIAILYESKTPSKEILSHHHDSRLVYKILHVALLTNDIQPLSFRLQNDTSFLVSDHLYGMDACEIEEYQRRIHHGAVKS